ncbi:hypothetical protein RJ55_08481 [Drechmeria coniospora]|nr:hypothetical protein RJ55_08481 [Drechmeria coniospora]
MSRRPPVPNGGTAPARRLGLMARAKLEKPSKGSPGHGSTLVAIISRNDVEWIPSADAPNRRRHVRSGRNHGGNMMQDNAYAG